MASSIQNNSYCVFRPVMNYLGTTIIKVNEIGKKLTFPLYSLATHMSKNKCLFILTHPLRFLSNGLGALVDTVWYAVEDYFAPREKIFGAEEIKEMRKTFWKLDTNKWKEVIDGVYQRWGRYVFDLGLHGGSIEPGFIRGFAKASHFVSSRLGEKLTVEFYLELHKIYCSHFQGASNSVLMGQEKVGVFRGENDTTYVDYPISSYPVDEEVIREVESDPLRLISYAREIRNDRRLLTFRVFSRERTKEIVQQFFDQFYQEIESALTDREKLTAITKLYRRLEWLHPVKDGSGRTNVMILNFLLVEYGFNPVIMEFPWKPEVVQLEKAVDYIEESIEKWKNLARG